MAGIKKIVLFIVAALTAGKGFAQQLPLNTSYLLNDFSFNPAIAGSQPFTKINLSHRNQWAGFNDAPATSMISAYGPWNKEQKAALGAIIQTDRSGLLQRTSGHATYAYHIKLNDEYRLGMGISPGMIQYRVKLYDAKIADRGDDLLSGNILSTNLFDINSGAYLYSNKAFAGLSVYQPLKSKLSWTYSNGSKIIPHYYFMTGYKYTVNKDITVQPTVLIRYSKPARIQSEIGARVYFQDFISGGISYRTADALCLLATYDLNKKIRFSYAYDISLSKIAGFQNGSHELFFSYYFYKEAKKVNSDEEEYNNIDNSVKSKYQKK